MADRACKRSGVWLVPVPRNVDGNLAPPAIDANEAPKVPAPSTGEDSAGDLPQGNHLWDFPARANAPRLCSEPKHNTGTCTVCTRAQLMQARRLAPDVVTLWLRYLALAKKSRDQNGRIHEGANLKRALGDTR